MTKRQLKRLARREKLDARVIADGCRDYVVEVVSKFGAGVLRNRLGRPLRFRSLSEALGLLHRCGLERAVLRQRLAHEEACWNGEDAAPAPFCDLRLHVAG